ncbi:MAG: hypothetical protein QOH49_206 [Acidobacteriota bacterium]|jgi:hypothetical protein|nr:hypothetical protein [Acidobacteriota bacterium]
MSTPPDPPIVVTGGSVTLEFDEGKMEKLSNGKHHHKNKRIKRIEIDGDGIDYAVDVPTGKGLKITIKVGD